MEYEEFHFFLKDTIRQGVDFSQTKQSLGYPPPAVQKPCPEGAGRIVLPRPTKWHSVKDISVAEAMGRRRSIRQYASVPLSLEELSFLLWATQGFRDRESDARIYRTVPSAGCRHPLETYLAVFRVSGLEKGIYRFLPVEHELVEVSRPESLEERTAHACLNQPFAGRSAVTFFWTAVPERTEWRYAEASVKVIALDAGHVCQNLYLACEAIAAGCCAIAAYRQEAADALIGVDGRSEFVLYAAPVGKKEH